MLNPDNYVGTTEHLSVGVSIKSEKCCRAVAVPKKANIGKFGDAKCFEVAMCAPNNEKVEYHVIINFHSGRPEEVGFNGVTPEALLAAVVGRLEQFQNVERFACKENAEAIAHCKMAIANLMSRFERRIASGKDGAEHPEQEENK